MSLPSVAYISDVADVANVSYVADVADVADVSNVANVADVEPSWAKRDWLPDFLTHLSARPIVPSELREDFHVKYVA